MAEGETQYNIPVSSKQLIVYFVFLVIALSAAFLAGVMVGKNVDASPEPVVRDIDDRTPEEAVSSPSPDPLTYGSTLQGDKIEGLAPAPTPGAVKVPIPAGSARPTPGRPATAPSIPPRISESRPATPAPSLAAKTTPKPAAKFTTPPAKPGPKPSGSQTGPRTAKSPADSVVRLTIQATMPTINSSRRDAQMATRTSAETPRAISSDASARERSSSSR